jgi:hypothetical protein
VIWRNSGDNGNRYSVEPLRSADIHERLCRLVKLGPLLERPYDYLGAYVAKGKARGWSPTGFYPTSHEVVVFAESVTSKNQDCFIWIDQDRRGERRRYASSSW